MTVNIIEISELITQEGNQAKKYEKLIEQAQKEGIDVECDRYPYIASQTGLMQVLPEWTFEGGNKGLVQTLKDPKNREKIKKEITEKIIYPLLSKEEKKTAKILVNPTGKFVSGGFEADTGLTGRKIMVDTYGGLIPHGGGCFSGKDSTKVDRSGAYMARFAAKNLVAAGYGKEVLVSVAYAIGMAEPLMIEAINEKGENLAKIVRQNFDFRPLAMIERLGLRRPIFQETAAYGHFSKKGLPWERIEKIK